MKSENFVNGICSILAREGALKKENISAVKDEFKGWSKETFDYFLLEQGIVSRRDLLDALSEYFKVPAFDAAGFFFSHSLLENFPKEVLIKFSAIPRVIDENMLFMVVSNPNDPNIVPALSKYTSCDIQFNVGLRRDIIDALEEYYDESPAVLDL